MELQVMLLLVSVVLGAIILYIIFTLVTSDGSGYGDNSFEAFVDESTVSIVGGKNANDKHLKFRRQYLSPGKQVLICYGTEYGFSQEVAETVWENISKLNDDGASHWQPRLVNAARHDKLDLVQEQLMLLIISTAGDGVCPTDARSFYDLIMTATLDLKHLNYSVLAMGDSNYTHFCRAGRNLDTRLTEAGAHCIVPRQDIDQENWTKINKWMKSVELELTNLRLEERSDYLDMQSLDEGEDSAPSRTNPFMAQLKVKRELTKRSCQEDKTVIHCEFDLSGSSINWTSGDALGIYPENCPVEVEFLLHAMNANPNTLVPVPRWAYQPEQEKMTLDKVLRRYYDLKSVKPELLQLLLDLSQDDIKKAELCAMIDSHGDEKRLECEVADVLMMYGHTNLCINPELVLDQLKQLMPRYYSISSSPLKDGTTACVTAAVVRYETLGRSRTGVCTTYLEDRLLMGDVCPVFVSHNPDFCLPVSAETDIIMIGPGTGLAPFMAFLQERVCSDNCGQNRLYFGCRNKSKDFIYQDELESWAAKGSLDLRVAFSRDQEHKVYVQNLMQEDSAVLWTMLESGSHVYVCGDAKLMAHDVNQTLIEIICKEGQLSGDGAAQYLQHLQTSGRYERDVWVI